MNEISSKKSDKMEILVEYFTSYDRIDRTDKNYEKAMKLDTMINVYNSDMSKLEKYIEFKKLYNTSSQFLQTYRFLSEFDYDSRVNYIKLYIEQIVELAREIESKLSIDIIREYERLEKNGYVDDYATAKKYVDLYLNYNESMFTKDFLHYVNLNEDDFSRYLKIVYELDEELYNKYVEKENSNRFLRQYNTIDKVNNLADGIIEQKDNYDPVNFYMNLPFYDGETSKEVIDDFNLKRHGLFRKRLQEVLHLFRADSEREIMEYVNKKGLLPNVMNNISERTIKSTNYIINGVELTEDDKDNIIKYMKDNKIPFLGCAFEAVKNKYVTKGLEEEKKLVK